MRIRYTLLADGPTDAALLPILDWLLRRMGVRGEIEGKWADQRRYPPDAQKSLADKIVMTIALYRSELLFIHRDAERGPRYRDVKKSYEFRHREIIEAVGIAKTNTEMVPNVCVIPVRMTEAWLLFNESAIRRASGNRNGTIPLVLPRLQDVENLPKPKEMLISLLRDASGLRGRRLENFPFPERIRQISEYIDDFSPLKALSAFSNLESDVANVLVSLRQQTP